jgi:hypothetical protein
VVAVLAVVGGLRAADEPTKKAGDNNASSAVGRGQLPPNFKKLGLSDEQTAKIREIHAGYRAKISDLEKKLHELRRQELSEELQVLTDAQKERLKELAQEKATGEPVKSSSKSAAGNGDNKNDKK